MLIKSKFFIGVLILFNFILLSSNVYAIGIGPGTVNFDYKPGDDYIINFVAKGDLSTPTKYSIYTKDISSSVNLSRYLNCSQKEIYLISEKVSSFSCYFLMPPNMEPGIREFRVGVIQALPDDYEGISVVAAVESRVSVNVPYPDYYLALTLDAGNVKINETQNFVVNVKNWGKFNTSLSGVIDIFNSEGKSVGRINTDAKLIESLKDAKLKAKWKADVPFGKYSGVARIINNKIEFNATKEFLVGDMAVKITNFSSYMPQKEIGKFDIGVQSFWSEKVDFTMNVEVFGGDNQSLGIKSNEFNINGWQNTNFNVYWDIPIEKTGNYTANVEIIYGNGKREARSFVFEVFRKKSAITPVLMGVVAGIGLLIIGLLIVIFILIKKLKKSKIKKPYK